MKSIPDQIPRLRSRACQSHKGTYGKTLIIGGCVGMAGAPALSARAALRSGVGLVRLAVPAPIWKTCCLLEPCATCLPLPTDSNGQLSLQAAPEILRALDQNDTIAVGPGLGTGSSPKKIIELLIQNYHSHPLIIDADGLNNLSTFGDISLPESTILTPHPGEMARLWRARFRQPLPDSRDTQARQLAQITNAIVVLKGHQTIVTDGESLYMNTTGNPGMATGGSGDVLTGMIAALTADHESRLSPLNAAILAVYIHGLAADLAAQKLTPIAMTALDIVSHLPAAWQLYLNAIT